MALPFPEIYRILLADDDTDDCLLFKEALDDLSISAKLSTTWNGEQLMYTLSENGLLPDLLFLDLNMPRKSGIDCLKEIKQSPLLNSLPVVIYSTSFQEKVVDQLYDLGALFYICKPSDFFKLKTVIYTALTFALELGYKQPSKDQFVLLPLTLK